ncbi:MAG: GNAT family N-acetyltransferase [Cyclobacteriaceae bacterium]
MQNKNRFISHQGNPPDAYSVGFELPVYYKSEYLLLHNIPASSCYYLLDTETRSIAGKVILHNCSDGSLLSMPSAPFGSFFYDRHVPGKTLKDWINHLAPQKHMTIRHPSEIYYAGEDYVIGFLESLAPHNVTSDINQHINLMNFGEGGMHKMQLRRIRKCQQAGFRCEQINDIHSLERVYDFLKDCRSEQGLKINIEKELFLNSFQRLPDDYFAFGVYDAQKTLIAATVTLRVTAQIMYNYLPGSLKSYSAYSPMTYLLNSLVIFMKRYNFNTLDLGVSSIDGEEQSGLARFKERMGAVRTDKLTLCF